MQFHKYDVVIVGAGGAGGASVLNAWMIEYGAV